MINREASGRAGRFAGYAAIPILCATIGGAARAAQVPPDVTAPPTTVAGLDVPAMIQPADWIYKPRPFAIFAFLPHKFIKLGIAGQVVLKCKVLPTSAVSDCSVVSDIEPPGTEPAGVLGDAALKASALFKIRPRTVNGTLSDYAWVLIPISINLGKLKI